MRMGAFMPGFEIFAQASDLKLEDPEPSCGLGPTKVIFDVNSRKGQWTILYFYPKADTPGRIKQACSFRGNISQIRKLGAELFGVSAFGVEALKKFKKTITSTLCCRPIPDMRQ